MQHLERALDGDPLREQALSALESVYTRQSDWKRLERQYRKLIHKFAAAPAQAAHATPLWWKLSELYRTRTNDRESARVALGIYAKLAPDDPRVAPLLAADPGAWEAQADDARRRWLDGDAGAGEQLFALEVDNSAWDRAYVTAAVLHAEQRHRHRRRIFARLQPAVCRGCGIPARRGNLGASAMPTSKRR